MMMNGVSRTLLCTAVLLPAVSAAQESSTTRPQSSQFNYSYVELSYDETDFDIGPFDVDGDGLTLAGSFELNEEWHAYASFGSHDLDFGIDLDTWTLGAGYAFPLREDTDLYGRVLYIDISADPRLAAADEDGLGFQFRLRSQITEVFEVEGGIQYTDVIDSDTSLQAFARYHFTETLSAALGLTFAGDTDGIGVSARFSF
jgi:opacity protein-like surface antigen